MLEDIKKIGKHVLPLLDVTLSNGTKIIQKYQFVLTPRWLLKCIYIEKAPNYLPLAQKCHFLALKLKYLF